MDDRWFRLGDHGRYVAMRNSLLLAALCFIVSTFAVLFGHPTDRTISVGDRFDDARRLLDFYGCGESYFNLRAVRDSDGNALSNNNFAIGGRKHALIWHDELIEEIHTFDYVEPKTSGTHVDLGNIEENVDSFTLIPPRITTYFVGAGIVAFLSGLLAVGSRFSIRIPLVIVLILGVVLIWSMAPTFRYLPVFPACWMLGWVGAFALAFLTIRSNQANVRSPKFAT